MSFARKHYRHVADIWKLHIDEVVERSYGGETDLAGRLAVFRRAFELTTPVALEVLTELDRALLGGRGRAWAEEPTEVGPEALAGSVREPAGGWLGSWNLSWPALEDRPNRITGQAMPPVQIFAVFPNGFIHPHIALFNMESPRNWISALPFQVLTQDDARAMEPWLTFYAEADMHERSYAAPDEDLDSFMQPVVVHGESYIPARVTAEGAGS